MGKALALFLLLVSDNRAQIPAAPWPSRTVMDLWPEQTVSVARLRHKLISGAVAAYSRALKLARAGAWDVGAKELENAVAIDPDFSEAHGNLGVHYLRLGRVEHAAGELRRAIHLDPSCSIHHSNLAVAMFLLQRPKEAEAEAQAAIGLDQANFRAHYVLGFLLSHRSEAREEAADHLLYAARAIPEAHLVLAQLFRAQGDDQRATLEADRYKVAAAHRNQ